MKKVKLLFTAILCAVFVISITSCDKDDSGSNNSEYSNMNQQEILDEIEYLEERVRYYEGQVELYQDLIDEFGWDTEWGARMEANQEMADDAREDIEYLKNLLN